MSQGKSTKLKVDGRPLGEREVQRGLRLNIVAGCLGMMWGAIVSGMPLTMFMKSIGASGVMIGLTTTVGQVAMALQIPAALLAERVTSRKAFFGGFMIPHRLLWFLPSLLPFILGGESRWLAPAVVGTVAVSGALAQLGSASWWSWMADLVPEERRATFWGRRHSIVSVASLFSLLAAGYLLDAFPDPGTPGGTFLGFALVFGLAALAGTSDIVLHLGVPEPRPAAAADRLGVLARLLKPFINRDFLWLTLAIGVWTFSMGVTGQFGLIYLSREIHLSYAMLSYLGVAGLVGASLAGVMWAYVMDRVGARNFGAIMMLLAPLLNLPWFFLREGTVAFQWPGLVSFELNQVMLVLVINSVFAGLCFSGVALAQVSLLPALSPAEGRTMAMAAHWSVVGLIGALGPVAGGKLMDALDAWIRVNAAGWRLPTGLPLSFFHILLLVHMALVWLVAVRFMLAVKQRAGEMAFRTALAALPLANPVRTLSGIYNIFSMMSSTHPGERASAARRVGEDKLRIAVRDLIQQLDDPAPDVREAAALALGRIGSPDAVGALIRKLDDPNVDLAPQIARALRQSHSPEAVEALIRKLNDGDRETVTETARALGDIGDGRARGPLLKILESSRDAKVVSASSEALARLGEMAALYEIIPRMKAATNPVLKRSLAIAVADLLGERGEFYPVMVREQRDPGSEVERLLGRIRDRLDEYSGAGLEASRRALRDKTMVVGDHLLAGRMKESVDGLFELAVGLAALRYGIRFGSDAEAFVEAMIWNDMRFGLAIWCIELLRDSRVSAGDALAVPDRTGILLGVYLLSCLTPARA
jgi:MFS family permease